MDNAVAPDHGDVADADAKQLAEHTHSAQTARALLLPLLKLHRADGESSQDRQSKRI